MAPKFVNNSLQDDGTPLGLYRGDIDIFPVSELPARQAERDFQEADGEGIDDTRRGRLIRDEELPPSLEIVEKAAKKPLRPKWREGLASRIKVAFWFYDGHQFMAEQPSKFTLHEIASPLAKVLEILQREENIDEVLIALGAPALLMASPDRESVDRAFAKREILLHLLHKIADNLPAPAKRSRGQPTARDLYQVVDWLADCWEDFAEKEFKRDWHEGKPATAAMAFVYAVVNVIDKARLNELPTVTKNVVADRRKRRQAAAKGIWSAWGPIRTFR
jgi:hypothetical protein